MEAHTQYSLLENPMGRGAQLTAVIKVTRGGVTETDSFYMSAEQQRYSVRNSVLAIIETQVEVFPYEPRQHGKQLYFN